MSLVLKALESLSKAHSVLLALAAVQKLLDALPTPDSLIVPICLGV